MVLYLINPGHRLDLVFNCLVLRFARCLALEGDLSVLDGCLDIARIRAHVLADHRVDLIHHIIVRERAERIGVSRVNGGLLIHPTGCALVRGLPSCRWPPGARTVTGC